MAGIGRGSGRFHSSHPGAEGFHIDLVENYGDSALDAGGCTGDDSAPGNCNFDSSGKRCVKGKCIPSVCQPVKYVCEGKKADGTPVPPCCIQLDKGCPNNLELCMKYIKYVNDLATKKGVKKKITSVAFDGEDLGFYGADAWGMNQAWLAAKKYCPDIQQIGFAHGPGNNSCATLTNSAFPEMYWIGELKPPPSQDILKANNWKPGEPGRPNTDPISLHSAYSLAGPIYCENVPTTWKPTDAGKTKGGTCCEFCKHQGDTVLDTCRSNAEAGCDAHGAKGTQGYNSCVAANKIACQMCENCRYDIYVQYQNKPEAMMDAFRPYLKPYMPNALIPGTAPMFSLENAHQELKLKSGKSQECVQTYFAPKTGFGGTFDGFACWTWDNFMSFMSKYADEVYALDANKQAENKAGQFYIDIGVYEFQFIAENWVEGRKFPSLPKDPNTPPATLAVYAADCNTPIVKKAWFWLAIAGAVALIAALVWFLTKGRHLMRRHM
jgi:hypothetical protein